MPQAGNVPSNVHILLEGFGNGQTKIEDIRPGDAFLVANNHKISLIPQSLHIGQYLVSQIELKPSEPLIIGKWYTLMVAGIDSAELNTISSSMYPGWCSTGTIDITRPTWIHGPSLIDRKNSEHTKNPAEWISVKTTLSDENNCYVLVKLKKTSEKEFSRSYILPIINGVIYIGHGVCSGPFNIISGFSYHAQLIPFDVAGNQLISDAKNITIAN